MAQEAAVPRGFWDRVQKMIDDSIARYARSGPLRNASITGGGLTIKGGTLRVLTPDDQGADTAVFFGNILGEDTGDYLGTGLLIQGTGGEDIASFRTNAATGTTQAQLWSKSGMVIATDPAGGVRFPYLYGPFSAARFADFRFSTTSPDFETVARTWLQKQSARLEVAVRASMDTAGTTGELRVLVNGVPLGATTTEGFSPAERFIVGDLPGDLHDAVSVEIQGRRTSATGALRIEPTYWRSRPSA